MSAIAERIAAFGWKFLAVDVSVFLVILVSLVIYGVRRGTPEEEEGEVVTDDSAMGSLRLAVSGRSKKKMLLSRSRYVSMNSLLKGTASREDWVVAAGIQTLLLCFALVFLSVAMILTPSMGPLAIVFAVIPGIWLFGIFRAQYDDYRNARKRRDSR